MGTVDPTTFLSYCAFVQYDIWIMARAVAMTKMSGTLLAGVGGHATSVPTLAGTLLAGAPGHAKPVPN